MFVVAHHLKMTIDQVGAMTFDEFLHWQAYIKTITPKRPPGGRRR